MRKYYCDACNKQINCKDVINVPFPIHIIKPDLTHGYTDSDGEPVSGRSENIEMCRRCSNRVYNTAYEKLKNTTIIAEDTANPKEEQEAFKRFIGEANEH